MDELHCSRLRRRGQPQGLPLRRSAKRKEDSHEDCPYGERRGQSRGLPLQREEEGSHEDCPYGGKKRAVTRTAPTGIWRRLQACATGDLESQCAPRFVPKRTPQRALKTVYLLASVLILDEYIRSIPSIVSVRYVRIDGKRGRIWARLYVHLVSIK